jgi:hypothetical protein
VDPCRLYMAPLCQTRREAIHKSGPVLAVNLLGDGRSTAYGSHLNNWWHG